jgi:putative two-component system response regulator
LEEVGQPVRVLVIEDDEVVRELVARTLADSGYRIRVAASAEEALELLRQDAFDLVLSDVNLPGMDGVCLSRILSQTHPAVPIVLITGFADVELARTALRYGATDFITKPFHVNSLCIVVEQNIERRRLERLKVLQHDEKLKFRAIRLLAATIDAKQHYTADHSRRVAAIAEVIGRAMTLAPTEMCYLEMAALVHDVGKIGVPDSLLNKQGELTEYEWVTMRTHPAKGAEIVGQVEELAYVSDIVRHHHERIDGTGYPDRLRGESIPLLARIVAVADAYESMTSDRVYRARLSVQEARRRLCEGAGTQFDPEVVEALIQTQLHPQDVG